MIAACSSGALPRLQLGRLLLDRSVGLGLEVGFGEVVHVCCSWHLLLLQGVFLAACSAAV